MASIRRREVIERARGADFLRAQFGEAGGLIGRGCLGLLAQRDDLQGPLPPLPVGIGHGVVERLLEPEGLGHLGARVRDGIAIGADFSGPNCASA